MPYILREFKAVAGKKIEDFLQEYVKTEDIDILLDLLNRGKITDEQGRRIQKNETVKSKYIFIVIFEPETRGLKPIFEDEHLAIFDKPSGLVVHPVNVEDMTYTLFDEVRYQYGRNASLVHRIDKETSGLVLVSKNKFVEAMLKEMFEKKEYKKTYLALVNGEIKREITIDAPIGHSKKSKINLKMSVIEDGKSSQTYIKPLSYDKEKNQTLVEAIPLTGRQHQIRVHLDYIGHSIVGDPVYGLDEDIVDIILRNKISLEERIKHTKSPRVLLQSHYLEFNFMDKEYKFKSLQELK